MEIVRVKHLHNLSLLKAVFQTALVPSNMDIVGMYISSFRGLQVHREVPCVKISFLASAWECT